MKNTSLKKQYAVFGLGRFGVSVTKKLYEYGADVLVIDEDEEKINEIAPYCTHSVCADATDETVLNRLGINNMDVAIVCIASNIEASIFISLMCKQMGIPKVISKASDERHKLVLEKIGVDTVIIPEETMGERIASMLANPNVIEIMTLADSFSMVEIRTPKRWVGKTLKELDLRSTEKLNIVVIKRDEEVITSFGPDFIMLDNDLIIVAGARADIKKLSKATVKNVSDFLTDNF